MKIFHLNKEKSPNRMGLVLMAILATFSPLSVFAQDQVGGLSDSTVVTLLSTMLLIQIVLLYVILGVFKSLTANVSLWKKYLPTNPAVMVLGVFLLSGFSAFAQTDGGSSYVLDPNLEMLLITLNGFLLIVIIILLMNVKKMTAALRAGAEETVEEEGVFASMGLVDAVPLEKENEILLDHDYDGIHELDNNLPPWWLWGFYITIFFAVVYVWYYLSPENSQVGDNEFVAEMQMAAAEAEKRGASVDESSVQLLTSESDLAAGKEIFQTNCAVCHLATGGGQVGPNLTDEFWIHGGGIKNVFRTIKVGVPEKGMISWESQLSPTDMQKVASFVLSLQGTNPEGGKAPEGEKWTGE
jgi:cytochrome c oxidase cbb3-type subunit 3